MAIPHVDIPHTGPRPGIELEYPTDLPLEHNREADICFDRQIHPH